MLRPAHCRIGGVKGHNKRIFPLLASLSPLRAREALACLCRPNGMAGELHSIPTLCTKVQQGSKGMVAPEMVEIELGIPCIRAEMIGYEFLHRFLSSISPSKIDLL